MQIPKNFWGECPGKHLQVGVPPVVSAVEEYGHMTGHVALSYM